MTLTSRRVSKPTLFALIMVTSAILAMLPVRWTSWTSRLFQPLAWMGWASSNAAGQVRSVAVGVATSRPSADDYGALQARNDELERQVGHQHVMIRELELLLADVSGLRDLLADDQARIRFATVIGVDASPIRESLRLSKGIRQGVAVGDWVAAGVPERSRDPDAAGVDLLLRQWLIGRIVEVEPFVSTVQLTTDPQFGVELVRVARRGPDGEWELSESRGGLRGAGNGRMLIVQAVSNYAEQGYSLVLAPLSLSRPVRLVLGRITGSTMLDSGLHYDLTVEPIADVRRLRHVYIISTGR